MGFSDLGKKLSKLGQDTKNGVQKMSDSVSISNRISAEKKSLERLFAAIGETVYKESPDVPKEGLEDEWAAVKVAYANIASLDDQLNHVKGIIYCPNCGRPADKGDKFCAKCGFRLDNLQETTGSKMAQDIKEAGQEVGKMAGDAADKTGEFVGGAAADTKNFFRKLKDGASRFAKDAGEKIKARMQEENAETDGFADEEGVRDAESVLEETAADLTGDISSMEETAEEIVEDIEESVEEAGEIADGIAQEAAEEAEETAEDIIEEAEETIPELAEKETAEDAVPAEPAEPAESEDES